VIRTDWGGTIVRTSLRQGTIPSPTPSKLRQGRITRCLECCSATASNRCLAKEVASPVNFPSFSKSQPRTDRMTGGGKKKNPRRPATPGAHRGCGSPVCSFSRRHCVGPGRGQRSMLVFSETDRRLRVSAPVTARDTGFYLGSFLWRVRLAQALARHHQGGVRRWAAVAAPAFWPPTPIRPLIGVAVSLCRGVCDPLFRVVAANPRARCGIPN